MNGGNVAGDMVHREGALMYTGKGSGISLGVQIGALARALISLILRAFLGNMGKPLCPTRVSAAAVTPPQTACRHLAPDRDTLIGGTTTTVLTHTWRFTNALWGPALEPRPGPHTLVDASVVRSVQAVRRIADVEGTRGR